MGIKRQLRLRQSQEFATVRKHGRSHRHSFMTLTVMPNTLAHNRYGFITSRRLGNAVVRNRVRRLLRESVRHVHTSLNQGNDLVLAARVGSVGQPYDEILQAVWDLMCRAELVEDPEA